MHAHIYIRKLDHTEFRPEFPRDPILWNIMFDGISAINKPLWVKRHIFAYDVAITAVGKTIADLQEKIPSTGSRRPASNHGAQDLDSSTKQHVETVPVSVNGAQVTS